MHVLNYIYVYDVFGYHHRRGRYECIHGSTASSVARAMTITMLTNRIITPHIFSSVGIDNV